ncbi:MAG: ATP-binding cassette domain-containing protein [Rhizobiales bacterium]|nr:ATP-binding cassette domain-containing protein [Hyphomicrobiales bacterium]
MTALFEATNLSATFGGLKALSDFSLSVDVGEIHGIIGPNGAGKTTAINVMTGFLPRREGQLLFDGRPIPPATHLLAARGIGRTFQSPSIFPGLTVRENVMTGGHVWTRSGLFGNALRSSLALTEEERLSTEAVDWLDKVGFGRDPDAAVGELPFGELRKLEIARALMARPRLLFLDEPTAGLTFEEIQTLRNLLRAIRTPDGAPISIVLIEHNVPLVFSFCDRVTALDKGLVIARGEPSQVRRDPGVVQSYLGLVGDSEPAATRPPRPVRPAGKQILEVSRLCAGYGRMTVIRDIDLNVSEGELVLLCGRNGAGKSTLLNALTGFPRPQSGAVSWLGGRMDHLPVSEVIRSGIGLVPQERGVIAGQSVDANLRLGTIGLRLGRRDFAKRREEMLSLFPALGPRLAQLAGTLSGGERQMLALARVLIRRPRLLLLDEPTIGLAPTIVDQLTRIIDTVHRDGLSIIVAEQNVGWVAPLADRAYMLEGGHIQASGRPDEIMRQDQLTEAYLGRQVA